MTAPLVPVPFGDNVSADGGSTDVRGMSVSASGHACLHAPPDKTKAVSHGPERRTGNGCLAFLFAGLAGGAMPTA